jgi:hypothetical protein
LFIFLGSSKFTNQEISMHYLVSVDHNSMTVYLTRSDCEGSNAVDVTDNMLWNDNEEGEDITSECGEGTDCEGGDNDTDW